MILFNASNVERQSPMVTKKFFVFGDGETKEIVIDLTRSPVAMTFVGGKAPVYAYVVERQGGSGEVLIHTWDGKLRLEFTAPPASDQLIALDVGFYYAGEK